MAIVLAGALASCTSGTGLLVVTLRTDLVPGVEVDAVVVSVDGVERARRDLGPTERVVGGVVAAEISDLSLGGHRVELVLEREGAPVVAQVTAVTVTPATSVTVVITRDCRGVDCGAGEAARACLGARCVEPSCTPETPEACPSPECADASECAASQACATPVCSAGVCLYDDAGICAADEYCDPEFGCVLLPGRRRVPTIVVSRSSDRAEPAPLEGAALSGLVHVFAEGAEGGTVSAIEYRIDGTEDWRPLHLVEEAPFDLAGGGTLEAAAPLDVDYLAGGPHTLRATVRWDDGEVDELTVSFTTTSPRSGWFWTDDPLRGSPRPLAGATLPPGDVYLIWAPGMRTDVIRVRFFVDDGPEALENMAPYDVGGTERTRAFDPPAPVTLAVGDHLVRATLELDPPPSTQELEVRFVVAAP